MNRSRRRFTPGLAGAAALGAGAFACHAVAAPPGPRVVWFSDDGAKATRQIGEAITLTYKRALATQAPRAWRRRCRLLIFLILDAVALIELRFTRVAADSKAGRAS